METSLILPVSTIVLAGAGAFAAWLGWSKSGEPFDTRKFLNGIITGVLAGIALTIANAVNLTAAVSDTALWVLIGSLALGIIGVDTVRTSSTGMIRNARKDSEKKKS